MRRALALTTLLAVSVAATAASAETWKKYANGDNGTEWSYDADYAYKDKDTGRVVVMKAISLPSKNIAPGGPGSGVGFIEAIDCKAGTSLAMGSYKPGTDLAINADWRKASPKKADPELVSAVCPIAAKLPVK